MILEYTFGSKRTVQEKGGGGKLFQLTARTFGQTRSNAYQLHSRKRTYGTNRAYLERIRPRPSPLPNDAIRNGADFPLPFFMGKSGQEALFLSPSLSSQLTNLPGSPSSPPWDHPALPGITGQIGPEKERGEKPISRFAGGKGKTNGKGRGPFFRRGGRIFGETASSKEGRSHPHCPVDGRRKRRKRGILSSSSSIFCSAAAIEDEDEESPREKGTP